MVTASAGRAANIKTKKRTTKKLAKPKTAQVRSKAARITLSLRAHCCSPWGRLTNAQFIQVYDSVGTIKSVFSDGRDVEATIQALREGMSPADIPTVRLAQRDGVLYSLDNRRLYAFQQAGVPMPFRMATEEEIASAVNRGKFTNPFNGGKTIRIRTPR